MATEKRQRQKANRQLKNEQQVREVRRRSVIRRVVIATVAVLGGVGLVLLIAWVVNRDSDDDEATSATTLPPVTTAALPEFAYGTGACPPAEVPEPVRSFEDAPELCIDPDATYTARFVTDRGDIVVDLDTAEVPGTVNNFVTLARYGYYDDTVLFRADPSIGIVQGGGQTNTDSPGYEIPDEAQRVHVPDRSAGDGPDGGTELGGRSVVLHRQRRRRSTRRPGHLRGVRAGHRRSRRAGGGPRPRRFADGQTPTEDVILETVEITET